MEFFAGTCLFVSPVMQKGAETVELVSWEVQLARYCAISMPRIVRHVNSPSRLWLAIGMFRVEHIYIVQND